MSEQKKTITTPAPAYRVFVSSTYSDMLRYRDAMRTALNKADCLAYGMERFGANSVPPLDTCFEELKACQIYICAIGMRYGCIEEQTQKSYTQLEYEQAESLGIPILAFLVDEKKVRFSVDEFDTGESSVKLKVFKDRIMNSKTVTCDFFDSASSLEGKVYQAIKKEIDRQKTRKDDHEDGTNAYIEGAKLFRKFVKRPAQYKNQEAVLRVRFDGQYGGWRLRKEVYRAFGFEPGYALFLNDLYTLGVSSDVEDDVWVVNGFADGSAADWLDDNSVTQGTIFEGRFKLAYEMVKDGAGTAGTTYAVDAYIANLVLLEGLRVISRDVSVNSPRKVTSPNDLLKLLHEINGMDLESMLRRSSSDE